MFVIIRLIVLESHHGLYVLYSFKTQINFFSQNYVGVIFSVLFLNIFVTESLWKAMNIYCKFFKYFENKWSVFSNSLHYVLNLFQELFSWLVPLLFLTVFYLLNSVAILSLYHYANCCSELANCKFSPPAVPLHTRSYSSSLLCCSNGLFKN